MNIKSILHLGDCLQLLKKIESNSIDLIFADPPYNLQLNKTLYRPNKTKVEGLQEVDWDKFDSFAEYDKFTLQWLSECKRILKNDGCIWIIGSYHNIFRIGKILQDLDFWILNDVVWAKANPMPNFKGTRFTNAHETLIWASHNKDSKYCFNYKSMKTCNDDKQMTSIWNLNICSGGERLKLDGKTAHPTQKPIDLLLRIILSSTKAGDTILDPFLGSGTTAEAAKLLSRNFIGIEQNEQYYELAKNRLELVQPLDLKLIQLNNPKAPIRVSIHQLIQANFLTIGQKIYDKKQKYIATLALDGSLILNDEIHGSIHQVAEITAKKRVNGWDYWYIKQNKTLVSINNLRQQYLKNISNNST